MNTPHKPPSGKNPLPTDARARVAAVVARGNVVAPDAANITNATDAGLCAALRAVIAKGALNAQDAAELTSVADSCA